MAWIKLTRRSNDLPVYVNQHNILYVEPASDSTRIRFNAPPADPEKPGPFSLYVSESVDDVMKAIAQNGDVIFPPT